MYVYVYVAIIVENYISCQIYQYLYFTTFDTYIWYNGKTLLCVIFSLLHNTSIHNVANHCHIVIIDYTLKYKTLVGTYVRTYLLAVNLYICIMIITLCYPLDG